MIMSIFGWRVISQHWTIAFLFCCKLRINWELDEDAS